MVRGPDRGAWARGRWLGVVLAPLLAIACGGPFPASQTHSIADRSTAGPTSGLYPTFRPAATGDGRLPPRERVWVNPDVVDRPGVPEDLRDRYWWTLGGDAGLLGTTAQLGLPSGEQVETIRDGIVVAARWPPDDPNGALELVVREFETGDVIREIPTSLRTIDGELVGSTLFWTGILAGDPAITIDGGIWATDVRDDAAPTAIVEPGTAFAGELCVRGLDASPTRRTLSARAVCKGSRLWTDIVDTESGAAVERLEEQWVLALTDDTYLLAAFEPAEVLLLGIGDVGGFDRRTGEALWRFPERSDIPRFASGHWVPLGSTFVTHSYWRTEDGQEVVLGAIDARTGEQRTLLRQAQADATLWASLNASSEEHLVMTVGWDLNQQIRLGGTPVSLIRLEDGTLLEDAFVIDPPLLCSEAECREG